MHIVIESLPKENEVITTRSFQLDGRSSARDRHAWDSRNIVVVGIPETGDYVKRTPVKHRRTRDETLVLSREKEINLVTWAISLSRVAAIGA